MDDLKSLAVFAEIVASGSMSAASRRLGTSPSAVSQTIRALEQRAGFALLHRSTRKLALTEAGERFYPHCKRLLDAARAAEDSLQQARDAPTGELRVSAPVGFATYIAQALASLFTDAPQLRLRLLVDDAMIDLIDARIDVAIRVGKLADSTWVARRLCDFSMLLCAAPDYLARHGTPLSPQELTAHQWLAAGRISESQAESLILDLQAPNGETERIEVNARIASNNQVALQQMCEHGLGVARLVGPDALTALRRGALVHVLPQWRLPSVPVWAVTPNRSGEEAKVRAALNGFKRYFAALETSVPDQSTRIA
jgi:DNA-binding transcriptional LysR family regulator